MEIARPPGEIKKKQTPVSFSQVDSTLELFIGWLAQLAIFVPVQYVYATRCYNQLLLEKIKQFDRKTHSSAVGLEDATHDITKGHFNGPRGVLTNTVLAIVQKVGSIQTQTHIPNDSKQEKEMVRHAHLTAMRKLEFLRSPMLVNTTVCREGR